MKKTSIRQLFHFMMLCHIFALICGLVGSVFILVNYNMFVNSLGKIIGTVFSIASIVGFVVLVVFSSNAIITLLKDFESLKTNEYISIIGKVLRFEKNRDPDSGMQINDKPVVLILDTKEEITLIINDKIIVGETYQFNYLSNSRIAEVVKKASE